MRPMTVDEVVGANLASIRRAAGLTQSELGDAMVALGFAPWRTRQLVALVEAGSRRLSWAEMFALAAYFEIGLNAFIQWPDDGEVVQMGKALLDEGTWHAAWSFDYKRKLPPAGLSEVMRQRLRGSGVGRPWAGKLPRGEAFRLAREAALDSRAKPPGPTYVLTQGNRLRGGGVIGPWRAQAEIVLNAGAQYTARDDFERGVLAAWEAEGKVKKVRPGKKGDGDGKG